MINLPAEPGKEQKAAASVFLYTLPDYVFEPYELKVVYDLIFKSIPNLPKDNILIKKMIYK